MAAKESYFCVLLFLVVFDKTTGCQNQAIGLEDRNIIPDYRFTATSYYTPNGDFYKPYKARLNGAGAWAPRSSDQNDILEIDLGATFVICAIATQGNNDGRTNEWTTQYKILTSMDNTAWTSYQESSVDKVFPGNTNKNMPVKHALVNPTDGKFIKFIPTAFHGFKALRVEVYGFMKVCSSPLGIENGVIQDTLMSASSRSDSSHMASHGRLYGSSSWCSSTTSNTEYIQVDLGQVKTVTGIATQGNPTAAKWVKTYSISYSNDNKEWIPLLNVSQVLDGNIDRSGLRVNWFSQRITARYIRVIPKSWNSEVCMRIELFGCISCGSIPVGVGSGKIPDNSMTASSVFNSSTAASNARLHYAAGTSWCASTSDSTPYLQIDLGSPHVICAVATQGNYMADQWVKSFHLQGSMNGSTWISYTEDSRVRSFYANFDSNSVMQRNFYDGSVSRYIRILPITRQGPQACMRTELFALPQAKVCAAHSIGVASSSVIPNHRFTASTYFNTYYYPWKGRLREPYSWEPKTNNGGDWLQVDLGSITYVCATAIQGNKNAPEGSLEWTKTFKLKLSLNNVEWNTYKENNIEKVFNGSTDKSTIVMSTLATPAKTKFIRFYPVTFWGWPALRVEIFGVSSACTSPLGLEKDGSVADKKVTSYSHLDNNHKASHGRLYGSSSWCSSTASNTEYIQVDLGQVKTVTGIATQGDTTVEKWVKAFTVKYSLDGESWFDYNAGQSTEKVIQGNSDKNSIVVNWFSHPFAARYIRIVPQAWNNGICMRVDMYGCPFVTVPVITGIGNKTLAATSGSYIDLVCKAGGQPAPYITWYTNGTGITSLSSGVVRADNGATSSLRVNYTSAEHILDTYNCMKPACGIGPVVCDSTKLTCRAMYKDVIAGGLSKGSAVVRVTLNYPSTLAAPSAQTITANTVTVTWTQPPLGPGEGTVTSYKLNYGNDTSNRTMELPSSSRSHMITRLEVYSDYSVKIRAVSRIGKGQWSKAKEFKTASSSPSAPRNLQASITPASTSNGPRLTLIWQAPDHLNGRITVYTISYNHSEKLFDVSSVNVSGNSLTYNLSVLGGVTYTFYVRAVTIKAGPNSPRKDVIVKVFPPSASPGNVEIRELNAATFYITWLPIGRDDANGHIITYEVSVTLIKRGRARRSSNQVLMVNATGTNATVPGLLTCAQYEIRVRGYTTAGSGPYTPSKPLETSPPGAPRSLAVESTTKQTVCLKWGKSSAGEDIASYWIQYTGTKSYRPAFSHKKKLNSDGASEKRCIGSLYPGTLYVFQVSAQTACGHGPYGNQATTETHIDAPPVPNVPDIQQIQDSKGAASLSLLPSSNINGPISAYQVIVLQLKDQNSSLPNNYANELTNHAEAKTRKLNFYITAEIRNMSSLSSFFTVGNAKIYGPYTNVQLEKGHSYNVYMRAVTSDVTVSVAGQAYWIARITVINPAVGGRQGVEDKYSTATVASAAVCGLVVVLLALAISAFIWRRRRSPAGGRTKKTDKTEDALNMNKLSSDAANQCFTPNEMDFVEEGPGNAAIIELNGKSKHRGDGDVLGDQTDAIYENTDGEPRPIDIYKFSDYVNGLKASDTAFMDEFQNLQNGQQYPWIEAKRQENKKRNRYANIIAYDHSRVLLHDNKDSDYINASYIHSYDGTPRSYIATQGPVPVTVQDFWQMVWQESVTTIVMLTKLVETRKVKCHQYWPEDTEQYGDCTVSLHRSDVYADYVIRTFILAQDGNRERRQVQQYQFTTWPDKGVPQHATSILGFRRKVRAHFVANNKEGPMLVHCSAGVGRTGAFIAIDAMLERTRKEKSVDIFNYVRVMRDNRSTMIQTEEQYAFVHFAILEALTCGNTEIEAMNLQIAMGKLSEIRPKQNMSGYALEYHRLKAVSPQLDPETSQIGRREENDPKNRFQDIVPVDAAGVVISLEGRNYINASFVDAYRQRNAFIMTQTPLSDTVQDFWHMIHQYQIGTIVMLNSLQEGNMTYLQYWPSDDSDCYDDIIVKVASVEQRGQLISRKLVLKDPSDPHNSQDVVHIQHTAWPDRCVPTNQASVLDLFTMVQRSQQQSGNAAIVVQCSNGVGRSGTFSAVYSLLERVKLEQVLDVFQAVKVLRLGRPNAVETLTQYIFCYQMVEKYLDSFSDYANFSEV